SLQDILTCELVSSTFRQIVQYYKSVAWDPDAFLHPWFIDDPAAFRSILKQCGAVVSGSQMIQFFDRTTYHGSDMDIFLRIGGVLPMSGWLENQGYNLISSHNGYPDVKRKVNRLLISKMNEHPCVQNDTVKAVHNYQRFIASLTVVYSQKIQLITVDMNPIHHVMFDFHSTAVMNYMTSDAVVAVFPISTFILRKSYTTRCRKETETHTTQWRFKYKDRGFRFI
ncbi:hypothetical protein C8R43DRAFT_832426, partial [Mycena crocata]